MKKPIALLLMLFAVITNASAQNIKEIKLRPQKGAYSPKQYYITAVTDDRQDTTNIGTMRAGLAGKQVTINLKEGTATAVTKFIEASLDRKSNTTPVHLHITKLEVSEQNNAGRQQADLAIGLAFYKDGQFLVEFTSSGYAQTGLDVSMYIEKLVKDNLINGLQQFDTWLAGRETAGSKAVKANVKLATTYDDEDVIVYNRNIPLQISDFKGRPDDMSMGAAGTYSGFAMGYSYRETNSGMVLNIELTTMFYTTKSWFKERGKDAHTLNHEQRHFDIAATVACQMADSIRSANFTPKNFTKELADLQKHFQNLLDERQQAYDDETEHGLERTQQALWNTKIDEMLRRRDCY